VLILCDIVVLFDRKNFLIFRALFSQSVFPYSYAAGRQTLEEGNIQMPFACPALAPFPLGCSDLCVPPKDDTMRTDETL
jgi:hypothetical protein